jgi:hypothetical protein
VLDNTWTDVALNKSCSTNSLSTIYGTGLGSPVDGVIDGGYENYYHSNCDQGAWWMVRREGGVAQLWRVVVWTVGPAHWNTLDVA